MLKKQRTLRTLILFGGLIWLASLPAWAQVEDFPRAEVFGGYSYAKIDTGRDFAGRSDRANSNGWAASINGNLNRYLGLTADFSGHYGNFFNNTDFRVHNFLFGPTVSARSPRLTGFAHLLVGAARYSTPDVRFNFPDRIVIFRGFSDTKFAMGIGGGLDVNVNRSFAIRGIGVDYNPVRLGGGAEELGRVFGPGPRSESKWAHNVRLKTGVVFKF